MSVPEPTVSYRSWYFEYERPRRMGWPTLVKTGHVPTGTKPSRITARKITVTVKQEHGGEPRLASVTVTGMWTGTSFQATKERVRYEDLRPGLSFTIYAPDWVMELAEDAVRRASEEAKR